MLKDLKDLEEEVGSVMRDREILVTRLIKVSKSQKPTRESLLIPSSHQYQFPSSSMSSSSISINSSGGGTNAKLTNAQSELQACEAQLALKERELDTKRTSVVRVGLSVRCRAMVETGWIWGEMGKEGLRVLEGLQDAGGSPNTEHFPPGFKPLPDPIRNGHGHGGAPSSDLSSVAPSQSASQIAVPLSPPTHSQHINRDVPHLHLDPPHAISDYALFPSHTLARRITEEDFNAQDRKSVV